MPTQDKNEPNKIIENSSLPKSNPRKPGSLKGSIWFADDFDAPMSEEELALWYDAPIFPVDE